MLKTSQKFAQVKVSMFNTTQQVVFVDEVAGQIRHLGVDESSFPLAMWRLAYGRTGRTSGFVICGSILVLGTNGQWATHSDVYSGWKQVCMPSTCRGPPSLSPYMLWTTQILQGTHGFEHARTYTIHICMLEPSRKYLRVLEFSRDYSRPLGCLDLVGSARNFSNLVGSTQNYQDARTQSKAP